MKLVIHEIFTSPNPALEPFADTSSISILFLFIFVTFIISYIVCIFAIFQQSEKHSSLHKTNRRSEETIAKSNERDSLVERIKFSISFFQIHITFSEFKQKIIHIVKKKHQNAKSMESKI
ncbi:hypothetical protein BpHYR1_004775 [Brachionus plicatilis]|uniref:Uncharacterized protein n=1 Tax=Brachionus plicatilis TaxID=10195 RepID=A0A3M7T067_BRAPC|nr:hypothetical protein BpHYR1_004775 [Brachionus plicatilis]